MEPFEPVRLGNCDDCGERLPLNQYSLCQRCDDAAEAFAHAVITARGNGASREEAYKAGKLAQESITKDMSPFGAVLFNSFKSSDPEQQLRELNELTMRQISEQP